MSTRFKDFTDDELALLLEACKEHWFNLEIDAIKNLGEQLRTEINSRGGELPVINWSDWKPHEDL
jgi:hypothetical protein